MKPGDRRFPGWSGRGRRSGQDGVALMMVLWVLVLLGILSLNFLRESRLNSAGARNLKEETEAYSLALSGYHEALGYILGDKDITYDFVDAEGNFWMDKESRPITGKRQTGSGEVEIRITDEDAKLNLNYASTEALKRMFDLAGIPKDETAELIDSILDWRDPDSEHHLAGAEDDYYEGLETPYHAKNAFFDVPEEIVLVKGMKPEYYSGVEGGSPFHSLITTFSRGNNININTVSKEVMKLLDVRPDEIETIMKQRTKETGGFRIVPQEFARYGINITASNTFRVEVTARMQNSSRAMKITAVVSRKPVPEGFRLQTVYWREGAEDYRG